MAQGFGQFLEIVGASHKVGFTINRNHRCSLAIVANLSDNQPAVFIATPVLKRYDSLRAPGDPWMVDAMQWWDPNLRRLDEEHRQQDDDLPLVDRWPRAPVGLGRVRHGGDD